MSKEGRVNEALSILAASPHRACGFFYNTGGHSITDFMEFVKKLPPSHWLKDILNNFDDLPEGTYQYDDNWKLVPIK